MLKTLLPLNALQSHCAMLHPHAVLAASLGLLLAAWVGTSLGAVEVVGEDQQQVSLMFEGPKNETSSEDLPLDLPPLVS